MSHNPYLTTLTTNLGCKPADRLVIVTDDGPFAQPTDTVPDRAALAHKLTEAAEVYGLTGDVVTYPNLGGSGIEPPLDVYDQVYPNGFVAFADARGLMQPLLDKTINSDGLDALTIFLEQAEPRYDAMLVLSRYSVSHTRFRKLLTSSRTIRAATMPGVEPFMFTGVMTADWPLVAARSQAVAGLLSRAATAVIQSGGGRTLKLSLEGRSGLADTGLITEPGRFGNLPGGEGFIAPVEGSTSGELSVGPRENPGKWAFRFEDGRMVEILGDPPFRARLEDAMAKHPDVRNVAELGVGTNEKASVPDNILEAEKILGTVHLALGDNAGFGGNVSVPFHQDYVVYSPDLTLVEADGTEHHILEDGQFLVDV